MQDVYTFTLSTLKQITMSQYLRFTLIENGAVHTTGLKLEDAEEMLERHQNTFPDIEWWLEQDYLRTTFRDANGNI